MKGAVLYKGERYYTNMQKVFAAIGNVQKGYNWLLSYTFCCPANKEYEKLLAQPWSWLTGEELTQMVYENEFQWIWGVLSGFSKDIALEEVLKSELPNADGDRTIWQNPLTMRHPLAELEIIAWDSCMTIVTSKDDAIAEMYLKNTPLAEDLEEYNRTMF